MTLAQKLSTVTTKQLFLKHSFTVLFFHSSAFSGANSLFLQTPVNPTTSVVLTSQLLARQGVGAGNVLAKVLWNPSSKLSTEVSSLLFRPPSPSSPTLPKIGTTLLRPRALAFKTTYAPDPDS